MIVLRASRPYTYGVLLKDFLQLVIDTICLEGGTEFRTLEEAFETAKCGDCGEDHYLNDWGVLSRWCENYEFDQIPF